MESNLPQSVGIIMDGNGRWAQKRGLPRKIGHKEGANALKNIVAHVNDIGIKYLIVYAFSTENWNRSKKEIDDLMMILAEYIDEFSKKFDKSDVRIKVIGRRNKLSFALQEKISFVEDATKDKKGLTFVIALDYGGRQEIVYAMKKIAADVQNGTLNIDDITQEVISGNVYTKDIPDPDIIIRTSGEMRLSNFLMWQSAYSELFFLDVLWPDFTKKNFDDTIKMYYKRNRRYGGR
ncbi:MAG: isoprenyl transferase [Clostridiales bacterium]|nr:isoprenyl transferase [Clostridiales bacterium]